MMRLALALTAAAGLMFAQDKAGDKPKGPVAKDQAEADLINGIMKEGDAGKRLAELDEWSKKYPETQFSDARQTFFLISYLQLGKAKAREAFDKAAEILTKHPDDYVALSTIISYGPTLNNNNPSEADMATTEKAANYLVDNADKVFAESNKPATIAANQWPAAMRAISEPQARHVIAQLWVMRKDNEKAETELTKLLQRWPNDSTIAQMLAQVILAQQKAHPEKTPLAIYYYARAAAYDGEGSLPAATRKQLNDFLTRAYKTYHGTDDGLPAVLAAAKTSAMPPADFKIKSTVEIAKEQADKQAQIDAADPAMAVWRTLKDGLTGANADQFFDSAKGAAFPGKGKDPADASKEIDMHWKGKIVSMTPAIRPKTLVVAVTNPGGDVTLKFETALPGKMDIGSEIEFWGVMDAYTKDPYMLTLTTEKDNIEGWKPVAAPPAKKYVPKKKAQ